MHLVRKKCLVTHLVVMASASAAAYHKVVNAAHRGELARVCNDLGLVGNAAELGVDRGDFARRNLNTWNGRRYYMIDAWGHRANDTNARGQVSKDRNAESEDDWDNIYRAAQHNVAPWLKTGRAILLRRFAEAAAAEFADGFFDWIYVDAGHTYEHVSRDVRTWWPKLRRGGMLSGDDFADSLDTFPTVGYHKGHHWGVKSAVANFSREVGTPFFLTFADRSHTSNEFAKTPPWVDDKQKAAEKAWVASGRVRGHRFYPAWYMLKP